MKLNINVYFRIDQIVYLKTDPDQSKRLVTGYVIRDGSIGYLLSLGSFESPHFDYEIALKKDVLA